MPLKEQDRSVVKKGAESDEAYTRRVLGKLANYRDLLVINDEAHHAYRKPADIKISKKDAEERGIDLEEATRWIEGLDRLHKTRRIIRCFDLSATPFAPTGRTNTDEGLFSWIVSDFGLNDAIEAGLVKTPRVVVRDDALPNARTLRPKLYHLYREAEVAEDLNARGAKPTDPLPPLVQDAYTLLGADWLAAAKDWQAAGHTSPPVMLTVCNRTETAARIESYFNRGDSLLPELHAPERTLRVDSKVLEKAEIGETAAADKDYEQRLQAIVQAAGLPIDREEALLSRKKEEILREIVDNVGKRGTAGQKLQNVISVAMLSEGWDAKNVTHIMGLRAFTSQLLCEQVIGRGLRRVAYDIDPDTGLYAPEFVNVFGVPLSVALPPGGDGPPPPPPKPAEVFDAPEAPAVRPIDPKLPVDGVALLLGANASDMWVYVNGYSAVVSRATGCATEAYVDNPLLKQLVTSETGDDPGEELAKDDVKRAIRELVGLGRRFEATDHRFAGPIHWSLDGRHIFVAVRGKLFHSRDGGKHYDEALDRPAA